MEQGLIMRLVLSLILFFICTPLQANTRDGLVGWWTFDETTGTSAFDSSWNGNVGTATGTTIIPNCARSVCRQFNGSGNKVTPGAKNYVASGTGFTYSAWLQLNDFSLQQFPVAIQLQDSGGNPWEVFYSNFVGYTGINFGSNLGWANGYTNVAAPTGLQFHHLLITYNGGTQATLGNYAMYLDGVSQSLSAASSFASRSNANLIGDDGGNNFWDGKIDDIRIYNRALTAQEVKDLYNVGPRLFYAPNT